MKRSLTLLVANIFATLYSAYLLFTFGGAVIQAGGEEFVEAVGTYFEAVFALVGTSSSAVNFLYAVVILLCVHIVCFVLGAFFGWLSLLFKGSGGAKFAAVLYLLGTLCFPVYLFFGLPITIVGFVGARKQKQINTERKQQTTTSAAISTPETPTE